MKLKQQHLSIQSETYFLDLVTPVAAYLKLRDFYAGSLLLESSEYSSLENSKSIIALNPIYELKDHNGTIHINKFYDKIAEAPLDTPTVEKNCIAFFDSVHMNKTPTSINGFLGYQNFSLFSTVEGIKQSNKDVVAIPSVRYAIYEFVLIFDHFKNLLTIIHNQLDGQTTRNIGDIYNSVLSAPISEHKIEFAEQEEVDCTEEEYLEMVEQGKYHCRKGDVFQIVLSRHFSKSYIGDEFMLYRQLRSVNPSPYLFYFDYIDYQLIGSSPEAQLVIENNRATLQPIAGTYLREGNTEIDLINAKKLLQDKKENAEHIMLVDLARNDLSKFCDDVNVASYREIQMYSHVIHLVSKVVGAIKKEIHPFSALLAVSPTGTLSGAPKHRAIKLINQIEHTDRSFYGGSVGIINFDGSINQAITIRSCLLKDGKIHYRAGAGVVDASISKNELKEVYNKTNAIRECLRNSSINKHIK